MRRALAVLALGALLAGTSFADLPAMSPCAPPSSGNAYPVDGNGQPIPGGVVVPFHLAYVCVPPCLIFGGLAGAGSAYDTSSYSTPVGSLPTYVWHFHEDELGRCWLKVTVIDGDPVTQTDSWFRAMGV